MEQACHVGKVPRMFIPLIDETLPHVSGFLDDTVESTFMSKQPEVIKDLLDQKRGLIMEEACRMENVSRMSICLIDETFPHVSGLLDDTMESAFMSKQPEAIKDLLDQVQLENTRDELTPRDEGQMKDSYESRPGFQMENSYAVGFSMPTASVQDHPEDLPNITAGSQKGNVNNSGRHSIGSASCTEKCDLDMEQNKSTFDADKDLKERFSVSNFPKFAASDTTGSGSVALAKPEEISNEDTSVEDKHSSSRKGLNFTFDISQISNSNAEQPDQRVSRTIDISQSDNNESNVGCTFNVDSKKQSTSITSTEEVHATANQSADGSKNVAPPDSVTVEPVNTTCTKHNATTDLGPVEPCPDLTNLSMSVITSSNTKVPVKSNTNCDETAKETAVSRTSASVASVTYNVSGCFERTLDLPESGQEHKQHQFRPKPRTCNGAVLTLDISQSSLLSLDEMHDIEPCPLVTSTPFVLERGFERLGSAKPTNIHKQLSVIDSVNIQLNNDATGLSEQKRSDTSKTAQSSIKSDVSSVIQKVSAKSTSGSVTSESTIVNKHPLKPGVGRKITKPNFKSAIPKTQIPSKRPTLPGTSTVVKSKIPSATQALSQPGSSSSTLPNKRRMGQLDEGKTISSAKNTSTARSVKSLPKVTTTTTTGIADTKAGNAFKTLPKPSRLQPPVRQRFGFKPSGSAVSSEETSHAQTKNKPALPSDLPIQSGCSEVPADTKTAGRFTQKRGTSHNITSQRSKAGGENCRLLEDVLHMVHELEAFLQQLHRLPEDCKQSIQEKLKSCLEEVKSLQTDRD